MKLIQVKFMLNLFVLYGLLCSCSTIEQDWLEEEHLEKTLNVLNKTKMALQAYETEESHGARFLGDLNPKYLTLPPNDDYPGVPVDAWGIPIRFSRVDQYLRSAGPDKQFDTEDDIVVIVRNVGRY
jgi:hypothetical protein